MICFKRKLINILFFFSFFVCVFSQDKESELRNNLKSHIDTTRVNALYGLGKYYAETTANGDSAIYYADKIIQSSKSIDDSNNTVVGLSLKGYGYAVNKDFEVAKNYLNEALILAQSKNSKKHLPEIYNRLAAVYENLDRPVEAIENYIQSINYAKKIENYRVLALSYYGISVIYSKQDQVEKQLDYLREAIKLCDQSNLTPQIKNIIFGSASQQFSALSRKPDYGHYKDSSLTYAMNALEVSKKHNLVRNIPSNLLGVSIHYLNSGEVDKSLNYSEEALLYIKTMKEATKLNLYQILAHTYRVKNIKEKCYSFLDSLNGLSLKEKPYYGSIISKYRHSTYKYFEDHDLAYVALDEYFKFENKKKEVEQNKTINELETKYQLQIKENKIKELTSWLIAFASATMLGFLIYYIIRYKKSKEKNKLLKEAITQQIELEKELMNVRNNIAQDFHDDLGNKLARISFLTRLVEDELSEANKDVKEKVTQVKEDTVSLYVGTKDFIFSLKPNSDYLEEVVTYLTDFAEDYFDKTNINFVLDKNINLNKKLPHYWSKQLIYIFKEAMTNAFKYSKCNTLILKFEHSENVLKISCIDNGIGMSSQDLESKNGVFNMKKRANKIGGKLEIITTNSEGTTILFTGETI